MSFAFGIKAISPTTAPALPHVLGFATPRTVDNDTLFEVWNGANQATRRMWVDLNGNMNITGTMGVAALSLAGSLAVPGTLTVTGNTSLGAALTVTGNTTLSGTLNVTGVTTLAGLTATSLGVSGNATVGGTLGVTGATTLAGLTATSLGLSGNATVGGTLGVSGASTLAGVTATSLTVSGVTTLTGAVSLGSTLSVVGTATFNDVAINGTLSGVGSGRTATQAFSWVTGSQHDVALNPDTAIVTITADGTPRDLTGFTGGAGGRILTIRFGTVNNLTIKNNGTGSLAANRIITLTGADISSPNGQVWILQYDATAELWYVLSNQT